MKRILILVLLVLCLNVTACTNFDYDSLLDGFVSNDSKTLVWPETSLSNMIPEPKSNVGEIVELTNNRFVVNVGKVSKEEFGEYVNRCMQFGFTEDLSYSSNSFYGKNAKGYTLNIQYSSSKTMFIELKKQDTVNDDYNEENNNNDNNNDNVEDNTGDVGDTGGDSGYPNDYSNPLQIYVGSETVWFYQEVLNKYKEDNNLPFKIKVTGVDTGSYVDDFLLDPANGADIFVSAHDNLGKLVKGSGVIAPISNDDLIDQIEDEVELTFRNVVKNNDQYFAVPIMRQALVLYYNKTYFNNASECDTWEEILAKAEATGKLAVSYVGSDAYNYSHWLLATPANEAAKNAFGANGTLELYKGGLWAGNMTSGDDQVAIHSYAQRFTAHANGRNGAVVGANMDWEKELAVGKSLTIIGGAWNNGTVQSILGKDGYGVTVLPKFTLTADDAYGTATAGMQFQSGSFYDVKCLFKKKDSAFAAYLDGILMHLASEEVQLQSFLYCNNLPAYKDFDATEVYNSLTEDEIEQLGITQIMIDLANAQINQGKSAGLPQPFGLDPYFNPTYYSAAKGGEIILNLHQNLQGTFSTKEAIKAELERFSQILSSK